MPHVRCVCVSISQLMYALRYCIRFTKMVCQLYGFFFYSIWFPLSFKMQHLRQCGRKAARFLDVFWQRLANTFLQNLLVFLQHCWVTLTNSQLLAFLATTCADLPRQYQIPTEIQREQSRDHDSFWLLARSLFREKGFCIPREVFMSAWSSLALSNALTLPLALAVSVADGASLSQREWFHCTFLGLESCKHICLLHTNNLTVLCSLTI